MGDTTDKPLGGRLLESVAEGDSHDHPNSGGNFADSESTDTLGAPSGTRSDHAPPTSTDPDDSNVPSDPRTLDAILAALAGVEVQLKGFHARTENYEQIVRQMQSRIEQLQRDQVQALLKPVIQRLAVLHAQAAESSERARERGELAEKDFSFFAVAIEEALGLVDIESVGAASGVEFDSREHHASRIVRTDDLDLDQRVQRVLRQGFAYAGASRVFLPAQVSVYRYEPPEQVAADQASEKKPTNEPSEGCPVE